MFTSFSIFSNYTEFTSNRQIQLYKWFTCVLFSESIMLKQKTYNVRKNSIDTANTIT